jgi:hypothetical protein
MFSVAQLYFDRYKHAKKQVYEMVKAPTIITALPGQKKIVLGGHDAKRRDWMPA